MPLSFEQYYEMNPIQAIDRNRWTEYDPMLAVAFHDRALFTPLLNWQDLGTNAPVKVTGREMLVGAVNHNPIALRQRFTTAMYFDSRERRIVANNRWGQKVQFEPYDELVNMWRTAGRAGFAEGILRQHLQRSIVLTFEKIARDAVFNLPTVKTYAGGATNFAGLTASGDNKFDVTTLRDVALRLSVRAKDAAGAFGDLAQPVPGVNDYLIITTPGVIYDIWDQMDSRYMKDLRDLQDTRIINNGVVRYQGWTFVQDWNAALFNAGPITTQVAVTVPIVAGDGAPDPVNEAPIDNVWYTGQASSQIKHYVQTSGFASGKFKVGSFVTLHTARTNTHGVTDGVNPFDGMTQVLEVVASDSATGQIKFRQPVMNDYTEPLTYGSLGGSANAGGNATAYAFLTEGAHIHPVLEFGARGGAFFAMRQGVRLHTPPAIDDWESVVRVSWDCFGGVNQWQRDFQEIQFVRGTFGNRGDLSI